MNLEQILHACSRIIDSINQPGSTRGLKGLPKIEKPDNLMELKDHLENEHKMVGGFSLPVWDGYGRNYCKEPEWKSSLREKLYDPDATWKDIHVVPWSYDENSGVAHSNHTTPNKFFDSNAKSTIQDCDLQGLSGMDLINKLIESACSRNIDR